MSKSKSIQGKVDLTWDSYTSRMLLLTVHNSYTDSPQQAGGLYSSQVPIARRE